MRIVERLYRCALRAHPSDVRRRDGGEMTRTFLRVAAHAHGRGWGVGMARIVAELVDVVISGLRERAGRAAAALGGSGNSVRRLLRRPTYALAVAGTLALGVGASTVMASVVGLVVLDALPFPDADRLTHLWSRTLDSDDAMPTVTSSNFLAWRELDDLFESVEGFHRDGRVLTEDGTPEQIQVAVITPGLLDLLGARPLLGRGFQDPEGRPGDDAYALLGQDLWARRYGSDPGLIGRTVVMDGRRVTVLGILPRDFGFPGSDTEAWLPVAPLPSALMPAEGPPAVPSVDVLAKMRPGAEREQVNEAIVARAQALVDAGAEAGQIPLARDLSFFTTPEGTRDTLVLLAGAVLLVLLIAAANVLSLGLSQAVDRRQELAIRRALGAGQGRILAELLRENLTLALTGSALGLVVAHLVLTGLAPRIPEQLQINTWGRGLSIWPHGVPFALVAALLTAPAVTLLTRSRLGRAADAALASARDTAGRESLRLQHTLLAGQMALAVILLAGTALMATSVIRLHRVDTGLDVERLLAVSLRIPTAMMMQGPDLADGGGSAAIQQRFDALEEALRRVPGVSAVASTTSPLPQTRARFRPVLETPDGTVLDTPEPGAGLTPAQAGAMFLPMSEVTPEFFRTAGVRVLRGRAFTDADDPTATVIVNEVLARRLWPNAPAVGRTMRVHPEQPWLTVVGVAEATAQMGLRDNMGDGAEFYVPLDRGRFRESLAGPRSTGGVYRTFLLRTSDDDPAALVPDVRRAVWSVDPAQPIERLLPLDEAYGGTIERERFFLALLATFAVLAGALAAAGVYALLSRSLARRTRELGIRVALGARPGQVLARLARGGLGPSLAGVALGVAVAWPLSSLLGNLLFEVAPGDPLTLALTAAALVGVAVAACVPPARRALRTDVVEAIRSE